MTDDLPQLVQRLEAFAAFAEQTGRFADAADARKVITALDTLTRALAEQQTRLPPDGVQFVRVSDQMVEALSGGPSRAVTIEIRPREAGELELICTDAESSTALTAAAREARAETLNEVDAAINAHLYTNTKNGHREAMFNITKRLRAAARAGQP